MFLSFLAKYKNSLVFVLLVILSALIISVRTGDFQENLSGAIQNLLSPFIFFGDSIHGLFAPMISEAGDLERANQMIRDLQGKIHKFEEKQILYDSMLSEFDELKKMLKNTEQFERLFDDMNEEPIPARVVSKSPIYDFQIIIIDKGSFNGLKLNMPVLAIAEEEDGIPRTGVVGKIGITGFFYSVVIPIHSQFSNITAFVPGKGYTGILQGLGRRVHFEDQQVVLNYLDRDAKLEIGDEVLTSGSPDPTFVTSFFRPYLRLGTVTDVPPKNLASFSQRAYVKPFIDFSKLKHVYIIDSKTTVNYLDTQTMLKDLFQLLNAYKDNEKPMDYWEPAKDLLIEAE